MTSPQPQQGNAPETKAAAWVPPPLEPFEFRVVMSIFIFLGLLLFAKDFYPAPREASQNVHESLLLLSTALPTLFINWRKLRSGLSRFAPMGVAVLYTLWSVWLGFAEPHRLIPWFLNPMGVLIAMAIVALIRPIPIEQRMG